MAPVKPGHFKFDPGSIAQVRNRLGLSQKKLAARLGVPANTLSRWETGATTPDADSLAAIYSVAAKQGLSIQFFRKRSKAAKVAKDRTRLLVFWDFQTLRTSASHVRKADEAIRQELGARFPAVSDSSFKAFSYPSDSQATDGLMELGWGVWEDTEGLSDDIISQSKSDCGHEPENTILVLLTDPSKDDFVNLVGELRGKGVDVYLMSPGAMERTSLVKAVGDKHWIKVKGIPKAVGDRTRLLVLWDFQHLSPHLSSLPNFLGGADASAMEELDRRFPATSSRQLKAFVQQATVSLYGYRPTDELEKLGWKVWEDSEDLSDDIIRQSKSDCGHEPEDTILVLLTHPGRDELADLVGELKSKGVAVYLMAPERLLAPWSREATRPAPISITATLFAPQSRDVPALAAAVGRKHWIALTGQAWSAGQYWWKPTVGSYW